MAFCSGYPVYSQNHEKTTDSLALADSITLLNMVQIESFHVPMELKSIPGNTSVVLAKTIDFGDGTNAISVLNSIPGVSMQSGTYATNRIVIRGMGSRTPYNTNRIKSYLNDIPLTTSDGVSTPEEIDFQELHKIEIIKGPTSALYGSGLGGSINLYTNFVKKNSVRARIQFGEFNTLKASSSFVLQKKHSGIFLSLGHFRADGYRENSEYTRNSILSSGHWEKNRFLLSYTYLGIQAYGQIPSSIGKTIFEANPKAAASNWKAIEGYKKSLKSLLGFDVVYKINSTFENKFTLYGKFNDAYEKRPFNNLKDLSETLGFRNKLRISGKKTQFAFGVEYNLETYNWQIDTSDFVLNKNKETRSNFNTFAILQYYPIQNLILSVASSLNQTKYKLTDLNSSNGDNTGKRDFPLIFSPKIGLNYLITETVSLYASAGKGYSMPSPEETLLPQGQVNPDIKPEQGLQCEAGTRLLLFKNKIEMDVSFYWIELNNLLVTKRISEDIFTGINAGKTRHLGIEALLRATLMNYPYFPGKLKTTFSFAKSSNKFIDFTDTDVNYNGYALPGIPDQTMDFQLAWSPFDFIETFTHFQYFGHQYLNDLNSEDYEGFMITNFKFSYLLFNRKKFGVSLYIGMNNIFNIHYASMLVVNAIGFGTNEPRYYYPGMPRNSYFGVAFELK
jgi:iron complex outermembrane receptor protein